MWKNLICVFLLIIVVSSTSSASSEESREKSQTIKKIMKRKAKNVKAEQYNEDSDDLSSAVTVQPPKGFKAASAPAFLEKADDTARKEYIELESNPNLPVQVKKVAQKAWAVKQGGELLERYNTFATEQNVFENQDSKRMDDIALTLSPEAQEADKAIRVIMRNTTMTKKQIDSAVEKKMNALPKNVYYELIFANQQ